MARMSLEQAKEEFKKNGMEVRKSTIAGSRYEIVFPAEYENMVWLFENGKQIVDLAKEMYLLVLRENLKALYSVFKYRQSGKQDARWFFEVDRLYCNNKDHMPSFIRNQAEWTVLMG